MTGDGRACDGACPTLEKKKQPIDSSASHRNEEDEMKSFTRTVAAVGDKFWKRRFLHQRIRNWQLCPDSIDKVGNGHRLPTKSPPPAEKLPLVRRLLSGKRGCIMHSIASSNVTERCRNSWAPPPHSFVLSTSLELNIAKVHYYVD